MKLIGAEFVKRKSRHKKCVYFFFCYNLNKDENYNLKMICN